MRAFEIDHGVFNLVIAECDFAGFFGQISRSFFQIQAKDYLAV